jgi:hypothetical protein
MMLEKWVNYHVFASRAWRKKIVERKAELRKRELSPFWGWS